MEESSILKMLDKLEDDIREDEVKERRESKHMSMNQWDIDAGVEDRMDVVRKFLRSVSRLQDD